MGRLSLLSLGITGQAKPAVVFATMTGHVSLAKVTPAVSSAVRSSGRTLQARCESPTGETEASAVRGVKKMPSSMQLALNMTSGLFVVSAAIQNVSLFSSPEGVW